MRMKVYRIRQDAIGRMESGEIMEELAHDLRSPMSCVLGAAQLALTASRQGKTVDEQLNQILCAVEAMDRMLEGMCRMRCTGRTAGQMAAALEAVMRPRAAAKAQRLSIDLRALEGAVLPENAAALERVLMNLISNAVKYTPAGGSISVTGAPEDGNAVFRVQDNGMGMKADFLRQAFAPFARAGESAHLPGKGLGLSIVRRLVRQLGGTVSVKSAWGKGSCFIVRVPLGKRALQ